MTYGDVDVCPPCALDEHDRCRDWPCGCPCQLDGLEPVTAGADYDREPPAERYGYAGAAGEDAP